MGEQAVFALIARNSMQDDKWEALKEELKRKFKVEDEHFEDLTMETADDVVKQGRIEVIIMQTPMGRIKMVRETRPVVLDKKIHYSHRAGQAARTEYTFSETEKSHKLKVYTWSDDLDDWFEIDASKFGN